MRARPVPGRRRADVERHLQPLPGVEARAAHLGEVPARPEIARPHLGIGLEPAAGEDDRLGAQVDQPSLMAHPHAGDAVVALQQRDRRSVVEDRDLLAFGAAVQRLHQFLAAAPDMAGEPAPELELAVDPERLAAEPQLKAHALLAHPQPGVKAPRDQNLGQVGVAAVFGQPADIVVILFLGIGADIDIGEFVVADVGDQPGEVVEAVIDDAPGAAGKRRIAAAPVLRRDLQHQHSGAPLARRKCGTGRGIAGPDHDHVELFAAGDVHGSHPLRLQSRLLRPVCAACARRDYSDALEPRRRPLCRGSMKPVPFCPSTSRC